MKATIVRIFLISLLALCTSCGQANKDTVESPTPKPVASSRPSEEVMKITSALDAYVRRGTHSVYWLRDASEKQKALDHLAVLDREIGKASKVSKQAAQSAYAYGKIAKSFLKGVSKESNGKRNVSIDTLVSGNQATLLFIPESQGFNASILIPSNGFASCQTEDQNPNNLKVLSVPTYRIPLPLEVAIVMHECGHVDRRVRFGKLPSPEANDREEAEMHLLGASILDHYSGGKYVQKARELASRPANSLEGVLALITSDELEEMSKLCSSEEFSEEARGTIGFINLFAVGFQYVNATGRATDLDVYRVSYRVLDARKWLR